MMKIIDNRIYKLLKNQINDLNEKFKYIDKLKPGSKINVISGYNTTEVVIIERFINEYTIIGRSDYSKNDKFTVDLLEEVFIDEKQSKKYENI